MSLNYDTLLDDRLAIVSPLDAIDDYIERRHPQWSLIKLHGSVNWGRAILDQQFNFGRIPSHVELGPEILVRRYSSLDEVRQDGTIRQGVPHQYYPALSVPVGSADELVCPQRHVDHLKETLGAAYDGVDLLVIGYSANDQEVLNILRGVGRPIRSLAVVNQNAESAAQVAMRLREELTMLGPPEPWVFQGRYAEFATERELRGYLDWLSAQPSRAAFASG